MARVLTGYSDLVDAANIAHELVQGPHARIKEIEIRYIESTEKGNGKGCGAYGRIRMRDLLNRWIEAIALDEVGDDAETAWQKTAPVVIEFYREQWDNLTGTQQRALVDHMLCFPADVSVAGPKVEASVTRRYSGELVSIRTAAGHFLSGTPNHPVLTGRGWVALGDLREGDHVVSSSRPERVAAAVDPDEHQVPARIEQVAGASHVASRLVPEAAHDLNADAAHRQIEVVRADRLLLDRLAAAGDQHISEVFLGGRDVAQVALRGEGDARPRLRRVGLAPVGGLGFLQRGEHGGGLVGAGETRALGFAERANRAGLFQYAAHEHRTGLRAFGQLIDGFAGSVAGQDDVRVALVAQPRADRDTGALEAVGDGGAGNPDFLGNLTKRCAGLVALDKVVEIGRRMFSGHVYNLQTTEQWYLANGVVAHNCHLVIDKGKLKVIQHTVGEFVGVRQRNGDWLPILAEFTKGVQPPLDLAAPSGNGTAEAVGANA